MKKLRETANLSQQGLANELNLTQQIIHSYENDIYEPDITTLKLIANCFNTSIDYVVGNTEIPNKIEKVNKCHLNAE